MFSVQPQPTTRSAPRISSAASGEAKPPVTSRSHGSPRNRPLATAEVASSAPHALGQRRQRLAPAPRGAPRPATNTGRRAAASSVGQRRRPRSGARHRRRAGAGRPAARPAGPVDGLRACTSSGRFEHHRAPLRRRRSGTPRRRRRRPCPARGPAAAPRPTAAASAAWSMQKLERGAVASGGQHHQRRAALGRLGDAGQRVGQARALVHGEHADRAADPGVGVGHGRRAALVPRPRRTGRRPRPARW